MDKNIKAYKEKINEDNAIKLLLIVTQKYGTFDLKSINKYFKKTININFIDIYINGKNRERFLNEFLSILKSKIINEKYSVYLEALINCIKKIFYSESTKTFLLNYIEKRPNKGQERDIIEYFTSNFILYSYAILDSLAYFLNGYFDLRLNNISCDLIRESFLKKIREVNPKIYNIININFDDLKKLKDYRNSISHRMLFYIPENEIDRNRYISSDPNINFLEFGLQNVSNLIKISDFLNNYSKVVLELVKNILKIIFE